MQLLQDRGRCILKSYMRNPINFPGVAQEKRLEALFKKEMIENAHMISSHQKEMQELRDALNLAMQKFESISQACEKEIKEFKEFTINHICLIKERLIANDLIISEQKKTMDSLHRQIQEFDDIYASKRYLDKIKSDFDLAIKSNTISHINSFQEFQRELKILIQTIKNDLIKLTIDTALMGSELEKKIDSNFSISSIDKEGVLKQIRIYEKTVFIIEKKIENIYTLIERINKRDELCHRPA